MYKNIMNLKDELKINELTCNKMKKEIETLENKYKMGKINYFDYNEKSLKNEEAFLGYKRAVNELNSFIMEIEYRK